MKICKEPAASLGNLKECSPRTPVAQGVSLAAGEAKISSAKSLRYVHKGFSGHQF